MHPGSQIEQVRAQLQAEHEAALAQREAEVTAQVSAQVTAQITAQVTAEVTAEVTARLKAEHFQEMHKFYEQLRLQRRRLFGPSTEANTGQYHLFNEAELAYAEQPEACETASLPPASTPAPKARGKRRPLSPELPRLIQARWVIQVARQLQPLVNLVQDRLLECRVLHMDETRIQVLKEPGREPSTQSFMWVMCSGAHEAHPLILYDYRSTRSGQIVREKLADWRGHLMADDYAGYNSAQGLPGVVRLTCLPASRLARRGARPPSSNSRSDSSVWPTPCRPLPLWVKPWPTWVKPCR